MGVAIKDATEDSIVFLRWKGNLSSGNCNSCIGDLIPTLGSSGSNSMVGENELVTDR